MKPENIAQQLRKITKEIKQQSQYLKTSGNQSQSQLEQCGIELANQCKELEQLASYADGKGLNPQAACNEPKVLTMDYVLKKQAEARQNKTVKTKPTGRILIRPKSQNPPLPNALQN